MSGFPALRGPGCCSSCGEAGHNRLSCPKRDALQRVAEAAPGERANVAFRIVGSLLEALERDERREVLARIRGVYDGDGGAL